MKKFLPAIGIVLFPYAILFVCFFQERVFQYNYDLCLLVLVVFWIVDLICAGYICAASLVRRWDFVEVSRVNMLVKIISIPAYLIIFVIGVVCMFTIFTIAFSLILLILDGMAIILSGLIGVSAVKRSYDNKALSAKEWILHSILQFVFCADVISSILVFHKAKKAKRMREK